VRGLEGENLAGLFCDGGGRDDEPLEGSAKREEQGNAEAEDSEREQEVAVSQDSAGLFGKTHGHSLSG
jgi:hypothetical protein